MEENVSKVIYGETVLIDLTGDTVTEERILAGFTAHDRSGTRLTGTCAFDVDSADATVQAEQILEGETAYARGEKHTGTMPNRGAFSMAIEDANEVLAIPPGYHDGGGRVGIGDSEKQKLVAQNIRRGITLLGIAGSLESEVQVSVQSRTVIPSRSSQLIVPDSGFDYLSQVTVEAIPIQMSANQAGGTTVRIGG